MLQFLKTKLRFLAEKKLLNCTVCKKNCLSLSTKTQTYLWLKNTWLSDKPFANQNPTFELSGNPHSKTKLPPSLSSFREKNLVLRNSKSKYKTRSWQSCIKYIIFHSYKSRGRSLRSPLTTCITYQTPKHELLSLSKDSSLLNHCSNKIHQKLHDLKWYFYLYHLIELKDLIRSLNILYFWKVKCLSFQTPCRPLLYDL